MLIAISWSLRLSLNTLQVRASNSIVTHKVVVISITWLISMIDIWYLSDIFKQHIKQNITVWKYFVNQCWQLQLSSTLPQKLTFLLPNAHHTPRIRPSVYQFTVGTVWMYLSDFVFDQKIKEISDKIFSKIWYFSDTSRKSILVKQVNCEFYNSFQIYISCSLLAKY